MEAAAVPTSASFGIAGMPVAKANNNANAKVNVSANFSANVNGNFNISASANVALLLPGLGGAAGVRRLVGDRLMGVEKHIVDDDFSSL